MVSQQKPPRVFLGTQEISGLYANLEAGFAEIDIPARLVITHPHPFGYAQASRNPWPARAASAAVLRHRRSSGVARVLAASGYALASLFLLVWSLPRFDAYIFGWGISILPGNLDLPILRLFRKRVVVVMGHGSEARPPYMSNPDQSPPLDRPGLDRLAASTSRVAASARKIERWADVVIGLPTTGQFFTKPFVNFYQLGVATALTSGPRDLAQDGDDPDRIVVLHVPSNPAVKGTAQIRECMEAIVAANPYVEYRELSGVPHDEVVSALRECTFVVDQLWSDIPMAAVGAEAAAEGRATVIGGYAWDIWPNLLEPHAVPPAVMTSPEDLQMTIERCIGDLDATREIGRRAREFVSEAWNRAAVARNYAEVIRGAVPSGWLVDPSRIRYGWGCGTSKENIETMVSQLVDAHGVDALCWPAAREVYGLAGTPTTDR
jgi:hypothetical protein